MSKEGRDKSEVPSTPLRVLIEGGQEDDWGNHYAAFGEILLPNDCVRIKVLDHTLSLVGIWSDAEVEIEILKKEEIIAGSEVTLGRVPLGNVHRPRTLFTQDGRIYHDLSLLDQPEILARAIDRMPKELKDRIFSPEVK